VQIPLHTDTVVCSVAYRRATAASGLKIRQPVLFGGRKKKKKEIKLMSGTPCSGLRCTALFTRAQSSEARPGKSASTTMTSSALICLFFSVAVIMSSSVGAAETDLPHVE
jgi:hypothetical protein